MVLIIGACIIAAGIAGGLHLLFTMDTGGPGWLRALATIGVYMLAPGVVVFLIGLGMWLGHPHVIHY